MRGESPYASHLLYTQEGVLEDAVPEERKLGMEAGFAWAEIADARVVYTDLGISRGMEAGIIAGAQFRQTIEFRTIPNWEKS
jgi:hypothetical protein